LRSFLHNTYYLVAHWGFKYKTYVCGRGAMHDQAAKRALDEYGRARAAEAFPAGVAQAARPSLERCGPTCVGGAVDEWYRVVRAAICFGQGLGMGYLAGSYGGAMSCGLDALGPAVRLRVLVVGARSEISGASSARRFGFRYNRRQDVSSAGWASRRIGHLRIRICREGRRGR